mmetsp:Transcript_7100/g.25286  ORF Transcript_7100/g.25286 Transcript_7100/m.25286 type:complete len:305 (+) Transcript_7100:624-1538(+)
MPSSVSCSCLTRTTAGSRMKRRATSIVAIGSVALNSPTCTSRGSPEKRSYMSSRKSSLSISSASSRMTRRTARASRQPSRSMCSSRPGVATTTCGPLRSVRRSLPVLLPPTSRCVLTPVNSPSAVMTPALWRASSRVGDTMSACVSWRDASTSCSVATLNAPVLPVPDCACAIVSRPLSSGAMALPWMALGFSKPKAKMPRSTSSRNSRSSNDSTLSVTLGTNSSSSGSPPPPSPPPPPETRTCTVSSSSLSSGLASSAPHSRSSAAAVGSAIAALSPTPSTTLVVDVAMADADATSKSLPFAC